MKNLIKLKLTKWEQLKMFPFVKKVLVLSYSILAEYENNQRLRNVPT